MCTVRGAPSTRIVVAATQVSWVHSVDEVSAGSKGPQVVVYDEAAVQTPGRFVPQADVGRLAVVAMSGLMAEADAYGRASGANEDLSMLGQVMLRAQPQMAANEQQDMTRYAALTAWT